METKPMINDISFSDILKGELLMLERTGSKDSVFVRECFLTCGSISDPKKGYHLQFSLVSESQAKKLMRLLARYSINAKVMKRGSQTVVYIKDSEAIEDTVTLMGGSKTTLLIMDVKVHKEIVNNANRRTNCDSGNLHKTVAAAAKQLDSIRYIERTKGLSYLDNELREIAEIRIQNAALSLSDLLLLLPQKLSRSGLCRRLQRIVKIAEGLK
jgi:hypothetical protein